MRAAAVWWLQVFNQQKWEKLISYKQLWWQHYSELSINQTHYTFCSAVHRELGPICITFWDFGEASVPYLPTPAMMFFFLSGLRQKQRCRDAISCQKCNKTEHCCLTWLHPAKSENQEHWSAYIKRSRKTNIHGAVHSIIFMYFSNLIYALFCKSWFTIYVYI